jgi:hypothetical protein
VTREQTAGRRAQRGARRLCYHDALSGIDTPSAGTVQPPFHPPMLFPANLAHEPTSAGVELLDSHCPQSRQQAVPESAVTFALSAGVAHPPGFAWPVFCYS